MEHKLLTAKDLGTALGFSSYDAVKTFLKSHVDVPHILTGEKRKRKMYRLESVKKWLDELEKRCISENIHNNKN